ncbi:MAG TPA: response regulator [Candidatus Sulfotelmatobacter sp.]|nr:response regulator [Candidatus Sulfotelmatobacter sp.]
MARKILLADDSVTAQNMGRKILADAGYEVTTVNNGSAALKKIGEQRPDLIVLDVYMPGYSGLEVCQRLKDVGDTSKIPILLTVGKLEPFKPEEAKRVRADGFIVKPFEASELLSALSKLEDKIVPRHEASKPGRLARVSAAIDEGRTEKVATEKSSSWKERLSFPKKKEKSEEEDADESSIYNPVNKDLRTRVAAKPAEPAQSTDQRLDLAALAPAGLPSDVTPEEIAALASAAAQMKGKIAEAAAIPELVVTPVPAENQISANPEVTYPVPPQPSADVASHAAPTEPTPAAATTEPAASEKIEAKVSDSAPAEGMPASSVLEDAPIAENAAPGNVVAALGIHLPAPEADLPVTMAVAPANESAGSGPRWTAVSVALTPEETGLSLDHEMQKAYAAFAAADGRSSSATESAPNPSSAPENSVAVVTTSPEPAPSISAEFVPEPTPPSATVEVASSSPAVKDFETVASPAEAKTSTAEEDLNSRPAYDSQTVSSETSEPAVAQSEADPIAAIAASLEQSLPTPVGESEVVPPAQETQKSDESNSDTPAPEVNLVSAVSEELSAPQESPVASAPAPEQDVLTTVDETAKKESEIAANTAAAWASWRKIRESGNSMSSNSFTDSEESAPQDVAAMAVAAGAEKLGEQSNNSPETESADIASLVESVLADLRPKIAAEISKKLKHKQ